MIYPAVIERLEAKDMSSRKANIIAHMILEFQLDHDKQIVALDEIDNTTTIDQIEIILSRLEYRHANKK